MLLRVAGIITCLGILYFSIFRMYAINLSSTTFSEVESKKIEQIDAKILSDLDRILESSLVSFKEASKLSRIYSALGESTNDPDKRLKYVCETLLALEKAIRLEPYNARALVTWASVKQVLGGHTCSSTDKDSIAKGSWELAVDMALKSAPLDQQALFNSALVLLWGNKAEKSLPVFKKVLELATDTSAAQKEFIYALVKDEATLEQLIPAKIPQALDFLSFVTSPRRDINLSERLSNGLNALRINSLREFSERYSRGEINDQIYETRVAQAWELSRNSKAQSVADKLLYDFYSENKNFELAKFFEQRFSLTEIKTLAALRLADSRPQKSALSDWGSQRFISLDNFFTSIGFYLPRNSSLRRIELHSSKDFKDSPKNFIRILASDDNNSWEDITGSADISTVNFNSKIIIKIDVPSSTRLFWKINFQNSSREARFSGPLDSMVRILGTGGLR
jgi:hypothetical protein